MTCENLNLYIRFIVDLVFDNGVHHGLNTGLGFPILGKKPIIPCRRCCC